MIAKDLKDYRGVLLSCRKQRAEYDEVLGLFKGHFIEDQRLFQKADGKV